MINVRPTKISVPGKFWNLNAQKSVSRDPVVTAFSKYFAIGHRLHMRLPFQDDSCRAQGDLYKTSSQSHDEYLDDDYHRAWLSIYHLEGKWTIGEFSQVLEWFKTYVYLRPSISASSRLVFIWCQAGGKYQRAGYRVSISGYLKEGHLYLEVLMIGYVSPYSYGDFLAKRSKQNQSRDFTVLRLGFDSANGI